MLITINKNYQSQKATIIKLVSTFFDNKMHLTGGSRNIIKVTSLNDQKVNIKFFKKPGLIKAVIYSFFRSSKAKRSFENANYLIKNNIETPFPIAYIENRNFFGLLSSSFYICLHIDYDFTMRELIHDPLFKNRQKIIEDFTYFTYRMHEVKINFLDHSPGNTLISFSNDEKYIFHLVDLNRMKFESLSIPKRMDNFKKMWLSKTMIKIVATKYAELSKQNYQEIHKILLHKSNKFKLKTARKKYLKNKFKI